VALRQVSGGAELLALVSNSLAFSFEHDEVEGEDADLVAAFLSEVSDWGDILDDIGPGGSVQAAASLTARMRELETAGFRVFAGKYVRELDSREHAPAPWPIVVVHVRRADAVAGKNEIEAAAE
jgi:hypothetical protein